MFIMIFFKEIIVPEVSTMGAEYQSLQHELVLVQKVLLSIFSRLCELEVPQDITSPRLSRLQEEILGFKLFNLWTSSIEQYMLIMTIYWAKLNIKMKMYTIGILNNFLWQILLLMWPTEEGKKPSRNKHIRVVVGLCVWGDSGVLVGRGWAIGAWFSWWEQKGEDYKKPDILGCPWVPAAHSVSPGMHVELFISQCCAKYI